MQAPFVVTFSALAACTAQSAPAPIGSTANGGTSSASTGGATNGAGGTGGTVATTGTGGMAALAGTGGGGSVGTAGGASGAGGGVTTGGSGATSGGAGAGAGTGGGGAGGGPSSCPALAPAAGSSCDPTTPSTCSYPIGPCLKTLSCLPQSPTAGVWSAKAVPGGTSCCPDTVPPMGDPCPALDALCEYGVVGTGCPAGYAFHAVCGAFGWYPQPLTGGCNPPPPCPMAEPTAATPCPTGTFSQKLPAGTVCRYERGDCFTYWTCTADTYHWQSQNGKPDGCCAGDEPAASSPCPTKGVACDYGLDLVTCGAKGWSIFTLPGGTGGTGGASGGSAGAGGAKAGSGGAAGGGG